MAPIPPIGTTIGSIGCRFIHVAPSGKDFAFEAVGALVSDWPEIRLVISCLRAFIANLIHSRVNVARACSANWAQDLRYFSIV